MGKSALKGKKSTKVTSKKVEKKPVESSSSESDSSSSSSSSESEDSSDSESDTEDKDSSSDSDSSDSSDSSDDEEEDKKKETKKEESSDSSSDSDSSDSDSSDDEKDAKKDSKKDSKKASKKEESSDSDSSDSSDSDSSDSDSDSDSDSSDDEKEEKKDSKKEESSDSDSSDSDSDSGSESDSESSDDEEEEKKEVESKKRKIEEPATPVKKAKTESSSEPATLFVGRLSWNIDDDWLKREFEHIGGVLGARVIMERATGKSRGYGYVDFDNKESAEKALSEMQGAEIDGRPINLDMSTSKPHTPSNRTNDRAKQFGDSQSLPSDTLFLGNLSFNANRDNLFTTFSEYGSVISVRIPTHPDTEQPKGFGYVQFSSVDEAKAALEALNGEYLEGRAVRLDYSTPRDPSTRGTPRGGSGAPRGGRGGRNVGGAFGRRDGPAATGANRAPLNAEFKGNKKTFD